MLKWFRRKKKSKLPTRIKGNACLNCQVLLEGDEEFCPVCGQRNNINPLNFNIVVDEFVGNLFGFDSKVWRTVVPLLIKPGKTAYDFISGKRKSLVNPFRSYITISLIFFLVFGVLSSLLSVDGEEPKLVSFNSSNATASTKMPKDLDSLQQIKFNDSVRKKDSIKKPKILDSLQLVKFNDSIIPIIKNTKSRFNNFKNIISFYENNRHLSTPQALAKLDQEPTFMNRFAYDRVQTFYEIDGDEEDRFNDKIISGLSLTIFLILPLLALVLKLIYIRRRYTYMEHMVFVFYTQSVFFLILLIFTIIYYAVGQNEIAYFISMLLFTIYLFMAMKRFYKQHWFKTFIKFIIANFAFMFIAMVGFMFLALISFILY